MWDKIVAGGLEELTEADHALLPTFDVSEEQKNDWIEQLRTEFNQPLSEFQPAFDRWFKKPNFLHWGHWLSELFEGPMTSRQAGFFSGGSTGSIERAQHEEHTPTLDLSQNRSIFD